MVAAQSALHDGLSFWPSRGPLRPALPRLGIGCSRATIYHSYAPTLSQPRGLPLVQSVAAQRPCRSRSRFAGPAGRLFVGSQTLCWNRCQSLDSLLARLPIVELRPLALTSPSSPREQRQQKSHPQPRSRPRASFFGWYNSRCHSSLSRLSSLHSGTQLQPPLFLLSCS